MHSHISKCSTGLSIWKPQQFINSFSLNSKNLCWNERTGGCGGGGGGGEGALTVKVMQVSNLLLNSASSGTSGAPESDGLAVGNQRPTADQKNPIVAGGFRRWPAT